MSTRTLLKETLDGLKTASTMRLPSATAAKNYGEYYREQSKAAPATIDLSSATIKSQVLQLLRKDFVKLGGVSVEEFADRVTKHMMDSIRQAAVNSNDEARKAVISFDGDLLTVSGMENNYAKIRKIVNDALSVTAYGIDSYMMSLTKDGETLSIEVPSKVKFGLDLGHIHSNIAAAIETAMFNSLSRAKATKSMRGANDPAVRADIEELKKRLKDPAFLAAAVAVNKTNKAVDFDMEVINASVDIVLNYIRDYNEGRIVAVLKAEPKLDSSVVRRIARQLTVNLFLQDAVTNQSDGTTFEKLISAQLLTATNNNLHGVLNVLANNIGERFATLSGSPSIDDIVEGAITESLKTGNSKKKKYDSTATKKKTGKGPTVKKASIRKGKNTGSAAIKHIFFPRARNLKGQFTSILHLEAILSKLPEQVAANMGNGDAKDVLNYRTGRFAESTEAKQVSVTRDGAVQVLYSYMKNPYQTFEPGYAQGKLGRDPRTLIEGSIRQLLRPYVLNKLQVIRE